MKEYRRNMECTPDHPVGDDVIVINLISDDEENEKTVLRNRKMKKYRRCTL